MALPKVLVTRAIPAAGMALLQGLCDVRVLSQDEPPSRDALMAAMPGTQGLLCLLTEPVDGAVMDVAGGSLRVISTMAVGYDNIDVAAARKRGIAVGNTPGVLTETTADLAFSLLAAGARRLLEGADNVRGGEWRTWGPMTLLGHDLYGATLGLVGFGRIGRAMARRAAGFSMRVLFYDPSAPSSEGGRATRCESLDELLTSSDFVSLHAPLTDATYHLIGARELGLMKRTALLVNTARGPLVDPAALRAALQEGTIWAAALDVTEPEPIDAEDPLVGLPNCLIVPHIGSASHATRNRMARMAAENLIAGLHGEPLPHPVG